LKPQALNRLRAPSIRRQLSATIWVNDGTKKKQKTKSKESHHEATKYTKERKKLLILRS